MNSKIDEVYEMNSSFNDIATGRGVKSHLAYPLFDNIHLIADVTCTQENLVGACVEQSRERRYVIQMFFFKILCMKIQNKIIINRLFVEISTTVRHASPLL